MSKEIEAWCSIVKDCVPELFNTEDSARQHAERYGGIAVKLTGKMPRQPIERKTTAWVHFCNPEDSCTTPEGRLGIFASWHHKTDLCQTKVEITIREVPE